MPGSVFILIPNWNPRKLDVFASRFASEVDGVAGAPFYCVAADVMDLRFELSGAQKLHEFSIELNGPDSQNTIRLESLTGGGKSVAVIKCAVRRDRESGRAIVHVEDYGIELRLR